MFIKRKAFLIVLLMVALLSGCAEAPEEIQLNANVSWDGKYLYIENNDDFAWDNANITLNEDFEYKTKFVAKGKTSLELVEFTKSNGERYNPDTTKIMKVMIYMPPTKERADGYWFGKAN
ncbi:hypothetical protein H7K32_24735 [Brevibacillus agri]|uniref:hypothetical protein n=1 Tax=Brevibacillus agri TaxID=51101 RepID=UPI001C8E3D0F|nr:hypothetical protein [Brevibacillus agri]MBY0054786.1 hypothetical protein [Brevibacillus agri]